VSGLRPFTNLQNGIPIDGVGATPLLFPPKKDMGVSIDLQGIPIALQLRTYKSRIYRASAKKMIKRVFASNVIAKFIWQIPLVLST